MFVLTHLLFELIKIAILSFIYTAIFLLVCELVLKLKNGIPGFIRSRFWVIYKVIYGLLFVFSFTYYGDHGLGDESFIPLGNGETMRLSDTFVYFNPNGKSDQIAVNTFQVKDNILCASVDSGYMVYNLKNKEVRNFKTDMLYNIYASKHNLPPNGQFHDFFSHYKDYWMSWRFWLLP
jgi:hypothetical protein